MITDWYITKEQIGYTHKQADASIYKSTSGITQALGEAALNYIKENNIHVYPPGEAYHLDIQVNCTQGLYVAHFESDEPIDVDQKQARFLLERFGDLHSWKGCPGRGQDFAAMYSSQFNYEMELKEMGCKEITSVPNGSMIMC